MVNGLICQMTLLSVEGINLFTHSYFGGDAWTYIDRISLSVNRYDLREQKKRGHPHG